MDKFGIFKLLNSFLGSNAPKSDGNSGETSAGTNDLSGFLSAFNNLNNSTPQPKKETKPAPPPPLQASMLSVMNSHDEFIKRVKEKYTVK